MKTCREGAGVRPCRPGPALMAGNNDLRPLVGTLEGSYMPTGVLVVEDDVMVREVLCETLERSGFRVTGCRTGEEALRLSHKVCFDAFIIDHFLPARSGTETTKELRVLCPASVIIGISGSHDGRNFTDAGGNLFLQKPIDIIDVVRYLKERIS